jgi:AhpD family alkylhydroperoxidase
MADDVQMANRRLDASDNEALIGMAQMGADAFGYTADLRIDRGLAQLLRLRVSQLNNCTYCLNLHYEAAREAGIPRAKIDTLTAWWETELHSEAEQAALRYTEALTRRRHRPGRGVPALPRRARRALQPGGDPRDRRRRRQHECLDPDQACRGRDAGPCLRSAAAAAAPTPPRAGTSPRCQRPPLREKRQRPTIGVTSLAKRYSSFRMKAAVPLWTKSQQTARAGHWDLCPGASFQKHPLCMESGRSDGSRDTERAMSQENVEVVRRVADEAQERPEALWESLHDDVELEASAFGIPGLTTFHGPDGVREFIRQWVGAFEEWGYEAEEFIDAGDSVVVRVHQWVRGKGSGAAVENRFWQVWTFREGKVIHWTYYLEKARALEAAGLSE